MSGHQPGPSIGSSIKASPSRPHFDDGYEAYQDVQPNEKSASSTHLNPPHLGHPIGSYQPAPMSSQHDLRHPAPEGMQDIPLNEKHGSAAANNSPYNSGPATGSSTPGRMGHPPRMPSWDMLGGGQDLAEFDIRKGHGVKHLEFAEGDAGTNRFSRMYYFLVTRSIITRWLIFIMPVLALLWIPGIIWLTAGDGLKQNAYVWGVNLLWWSVWLTVLWVGWWASTAAFLIFPHILRSTVAVVIGGDRSWVDMITSLQKWFALWLWTLVTWIAFQPLILTRQRAGTSDSSASNLTTMSNVLFGILLSACVLAGEKIVVQFIAFSFHQQTYQDRMREQKFQIRVLVALYQNSSDMGRSDTVIRADAASVKSKGAPQVVFKKAIKGVRSAAATTATALGNVASEMTGSSVLQPNSPQSMVTQAMGSANKTRQLARRIYYSFRQGKTEVTLADIARFFPDLDTAKGAFAVLDTDTNGGATRDEIEMALLEIHRERLSLASSMRDLDGAVRRLDQILVGIVLLICILILTATITTKLTALVTSAGTFMLSLSWLIGSTSQEVLSSCIFIFCKHPYDVGDRVDIDGNSYVVQEMFLLSTVFRRTDGKYVFLPNNILNTKLIENVRRSGATSESFTFDVSFDTDFEHIQALRTRMLKFLNNNGRDYLPTFDVNVVDFPEQSKMTLKADICYKSNWQQGAQKVQRHNKWVCEMKQALRDVGILGPGGNGDPSPAPADPVKYTLVPYEPETPENHELSRQTSSRQTSSDHQTAVDSSFDNTERLNLGPNARSAAAPSYSFVARETVVADPSQDVHDEEESDPVTAATTRAPSMTASDAPGGSRRRHRDQDRPEDIEMGPTPPVHARNYQ